MASTTPSHLPPHLRHEKSQHSGLQVSSSIAQPSVGSISGVESSGCFDRSRRRMLHILLASNVWAWRNGDQYLSVRGGTLRPV